MTANDSSKIILRKNPDGTTTKVLMKKVIRKIKIRQATKHVEKSSVSKETDKNRDTVQPSKQQSTSSSWQRTSGSPSQSYRSAATGQGSSFSTSKPFRPSNPKPFDMSAKRKPSIGGQANRKGKLPPKKIYLPKKKREKPTSKFTSADLMEERGRDYSLRKDKKVVVLETDKLESKERLEQYNRLVSHQGEQPSEEYKGVPSSIEIPEVISIKDLALKLNLKASQILKRLFNYGVMDLNVNDSIDAESAQVVCNELKCEVKVVSLIEQSKVEEDRGKEEDYVLRSPVVTVMGHVDHGKTTLLDALRNTKVVQMESGGITQHIGAYKVATDQGDILFIDTPGHAAFSKMRSRGVVVTDLIILVVSATEGVKPQTIEVIRHASEANVPIVVAVNKIDLKGADLNRLQLELSHHGLLAKSMSGEVDFCPISALRKQGIDDLLTVVLGQAQKMKLNGNPKVRASGHVIESKIEKGRGNVATVLVKNGTLRIGEPYVCGVHSGRVRAMFDETGTNVKEAGPSRAVEVIGFDGFVVCRR